MAAVTADDEEQRARYCREIEAYLCRKNDGHLVRIVGPAFEQVCGWAARGVPIKVAYHGIDRYFERYYAKGPRRRPVRVEFCEADVLDAFDEWRRAVGVPASATLTEAAAAQGEQAEGEAEASRRHGSLPAHLERAIARLTSRRAGADRGLDPTLDAIVREIDTFRASARSLRGEARQACIDRLQALDAMLLEAAQRACDASVLKQVAVEAETELAAFRERMDAAAYERARGACFDRGLRERLRLPRIAYDD